MSKIHFRHKKKDHSNLGIVHVVKQVWGEGGFKIGLIRLILFNTLQYI